MYYENIVICRNCISAYIKGTEYIFPLLGMRLIKDRESNIYGLVDTSPFFMEILMQEGIMIVLTDLDTILDNL